MSETGGETGFKGHVQIEGTGFELVKSIINIKDVSFHEHLLIFLDHPTGREFGDINRWKDMDSGTWIHLQLLQWEH